MGRVSDQEREGLGGSVPVSCGRYDELKRPHFHIPTALVNFRGIFVM
jgi:hypothetical protein